MSGPNDWRLNECALCGFIDVGFAGFSCALSGDPAVFVKRDEWHPVCRQCEKENRPAGDTEGKENESASGSHTESDKKAEGSANDNVGEGKTGAPQKES